MLSIGQFSKICLVSVKTLHHYDKIGLIHPCEVDRVTGYRYYDESQISSMLLICRLKRYGLSLSEIGEVLSRGDKRVLFSKLEQQKQALQQHMEETSLVLNELTRHLQDFERTGDIMSYQNNYTVSLEETKDRAILSTRHKMSVEEYGKYYGKLYEQIAKDKLNAQRSTLAIYHDEEFSQECNDTELAIELADPAKATRILKGGPCAATLHRGAYSGLSDAYGALIKWMNENGYEVASSPYEIYEKNQFDKLPVDQWETRVYFPVKKK